MNKGKMESKEQNNISKNILNNFNITEKKCIICNWNQHVEEHHLQKYSDYGLHAPANIVYLCDNHHWVADFGTEDDIKILLLKIKELTGKEPVIDIVKKEYYDKLIRARLEDQFGIINEKDWNEHWLYSWNYSFFKKILTSRPGQSQEYEMKKYLIDEFEIIFLINKLKTHLSFLKSKHE